MQTYAVKPPVPVPLPTPAMIITGAIDRSEKRRCVSLGGGANGQSKGAIRSVNAQVVRLYIVL